MYSELQFGYASNLHISFNVVTFLFEIIFNDLHLNNAISISCIFMHTYRVWCCIHNTTPSGVVYVYTKAASYSPEKRTQLTPPSS